MTSRGAISFDRAAGYYDKTRGLTPEAAAKVRALLLEQLGDDQPVLEVGVGTGRIALPLAEAGVELIGIDLARKMLERLADNAGGEAPFPILQADATRLPFADASFGSALASWVFHLIPAWQEVAAEIVRVVRPGGVLMIDIGGRDQGIWTETIWKFRDEAGVTDWPPGAQSYEEVDEALTALGANPRATDPIVETIETKIAENIALLEKGVFSVTFGVDQKTRTDAAERTRAWATERFGDIHATRELRATHTWRAYDL